MSARALGVGLLGLGTVGSAVARVFADRSRRIDAAAGRPLRLVAAAVRDPQKERDAGDVPVTADPHAILDDREISIVVEVIGGAHPARELELGGVGRGEDGGTADKELVAKGGEGLLAAARTPKRGPRGGIAASDVTGAAGRGARVRFLAVADFGEKATKARVGPEEVAADSLEGQATGPTNVITLESDLVPRLVWSGPGAGGDATASAILGDVIQIARQNQ